MDFKRSKNGRLYPVRRDPAELARIIGLTHALACREHLSRRQVQEHLFHRLGIPRSIGSISQDLRKYVCDDCDPDRPKPRAEVFAWR